VPPVIKLGGKTPVLPTNNSRENFLKILKRETRDKERNKILSETHRKFTMKTMTYLTFKIFKT